MKRKRRSLPKPDYYRERSYRTLENSGLVSSYIRLLETDLHILASEPVEEKALALVTTLRKDLDGYIKKVPPFREALTPLPLDESAPQIVQEMLIAGQKTGVGPMAAVAGAMAEKVGVGLLKNGVSEVMVENGGDIYVARQRECVIGIYAGQSSLSGKVGLKLSAQEQPCGVCCSSGRIGHSLSLGESDAVVVVAASTPLADAAATKLANEVDASRRSVDRALSQAKKIEGISGVVIVQDEKLGAWGEIELVGL